MPYAYSDLELWTSPEHPPDSSMLPPPSSGVPARLDGAGRTLNFGLLGGELLGVDIEEARQVLADIDMLPESIAHVFIEEDLAVILDTFTRVRDAIGAAVDADGRAAGERGRALAQHPFVGQSSDGRLVFRSQRVDLADLRFDIDRLCSLFAWAVGHGLLVAEVGPGREETPAGSAP